MFIHAFMLMTILVAFSHPRDIGDNTNYAVSLPCDLSKIPYTGPLDPERFKGQWYRLYESIVLPTEVNITGQEFDVTDFEVIANGDITILDMTMISSYEDQDCTETPIHCALDNNTCHALYFDHFLKVLLIDYDRVMVTWSETVIQTVNYPVLTVVVRDPLTTPDLSTFTSQMTEFCGADSLDPTSGFYEEVVDYSKTDNCFDYAGSRFLFLCSCGLVVYSPSPVYSLDRAASKRPWLLCQNAEYTIHFSNILTNKYFLCSLVYGFWYALHTG